LTADAARYLQLAQQYKTSAPLVSANDEVKAQEDMNKAAEDRATLMQQYGEALEKAMAVTTGMAEKTKSLSQNYAAAKAELAQLTPEAMKFMGGVPTTAKASDIEQATIALKAYAAAQERVNKLGNEMKEPWGELRDTFVKSFEGMGDELAKWVVTGQAKFKQFFQSLEEAVVSTFMKLAVINPLLNALFGSTTGWNQLASFFSFGGGSVPGHAAGGPYTPYQPFIAGEAGPELIMPSTSGSVMPAAATASMLGQASQRGGDVNVTMPMNFMHGVTHAELAAIMPTVVNQAKSAVYDGVRRGGTFRQVFMQGS
jgi:phage-related minor tail protein